MPESVNWRPRVTQEQLAALSAALRKYAATDGASGHWEEIDHAPWFRRSGPSDSPGLLQQVDLSGLDLRKIELPCANLRGVLCVGQDLSEARLDGSLMREGIFSKTKFFRASLRNVDLAGADLSGCDLREADLTGAQFDNVNLRGARVKWDAVGRGRWLIERKDGVATGELGESDQDHQWTVLDQKSGAVIGPFDGHTYISYFGTDGESVSGVAKVALSEDGRSIVVTDADGTAKTLPLAQ